MAFPNPETAPSTAGIPFAMISEFGKLQTDLDTNKRQIEHAQHHLAALEQKEKEIQIKMTELGNFPPEFCQISTDIYLLETRKSDLSADINVFQTDIEWKFEEMDEHTGFNTLEEAHQEIDKMNATLNELYQKIKTLLISKST